MDEIYENPLTAPLRRPAHGAALVSADQVLDLAAAVGRPGRSRACSRD